MNFNASNRANLEDLLAALRGGLSGSTGYSVLADIMANQQSSVAARQARALQMVQLQMQQQQMAQQQKAARQGYLSDLTAQATNFASTPGTTYGQAQSYMDALTPRQGTPGGIGDLLSQLYAQPQPEVPQGQFGIQDAGALAANPLMQMASFYDPNRTSPLQPQPDPYAQAMSDVALQQAQADLAATQNPPPVEPSSAQALSTTVSFIRALFQGGLTDPDTGEVLPPMGPQQVRATLLQDPSTSGVLASNLKDILAVFPQLAPAFPTGNL